MSDRARLVTARALVVAASVLLALALVAGYARRAAVDSDQFANRATAALRDEAVRSLVAQKITDEVVLKNEADLLAARPIIESVASGIVGSSAFTELFRVGVRDVHRAIFNRDRNTVTLTLADVGTVLAAALQKLRPKLAAELEATGRVELLKRDAGSFGAKLARIGDDVRLLAVFLFVLTLLVAAAALAVSPDRHRTVVELGIGAAAAGVVVVVAYAVLRSVAVGPFEQPEDKAAASAVWDAFLGDLRTAGWIMAGSGAVIAASAASLIKPIDIGPPLRRAAGWVITEPERPSLRVVRGLALLAAGLIVILDREAVIALLFTLVGVYLIYAGVSALLRIIYSPAAEEAAERRVAGVRRRVWRRESAVLVLATALIAGTVAIFVGSGGTSTAAPPSGTCNGHDELCDRPLDEVALAATHNAMSVPLPGWYSAEQERPIAGQLADGVRGLLIDTHYADRLPGGRLRTYFGSRQGLLRTAEQDGVSPDAIDAALRIRDRLFSGEGERGMYLCHTFCELGGTPLGSVLDDIRDFLVAHPDDVVVIVNQDYVTPEDFVGAAKRAGLDEMAYTPPAGGDWPTLREMIDSGRRAIFMAENHAGAAPWYQLAYERLTEETPYTFPRVAQLTDPEKLPASCEANRGPARAPLFLVNHWISTDPLPRPSDAAKVNAYDPLLARMRECGRLRKHSVNLVAVNFYLEGDVFRVVDRLNGVR